MNILILTADGYSKYLDRRIVDQAQTLIENGHKVQIITIGLASSLHEVGGISVIQFQRNQSKKLMNEVKANFWKYLVNTEQIETLDVKDKKKSLTDRLRTVWQILPLGFRQKIRPVTFLVYAMLLRISKLIDYNFDLRGGDVNKDIWNDATSFVSILEKHTADLIIVSDLASGIASLVLRRQNYSPKVWYDAHEFGSEQAWLKALPGFTSEIKLIELTIVKNVELFSCVSEELTEIMSKEAKRVKNKIVLPNVALKQTSSLSISIDSQINTLREIRKSYKVAIFHGVLSDIRGIDKFIDAFDEACEGQWKLVLMGYFLEGKTSKAISRSQSAILIDSVDAANVLRVISEVDAVVMPYSIVDLNTQFCFPNKLGDCLAARIRFVFNGRLRSISKIAQDFDVGIPFEMNNDAIDVDSLKRALKGVAMLNPDWDAVEFEFGERVYKNRIITAVEKVLSERID
jgi:glycosyltransferase involved in cell wall biosynthesis